MLDLKQLTLNVGAQADREGALVDLDEARLNRGNHGLSGGQAGKGDNDGDELHFDVEWSVNLEKT